MRRRIALLTPKAFASLALRVKLRNDVILFRASFWSARAMPAHHNLRDAGQILPSNRLRSFRRRDVRQQCACSL
jgi:hypothetical protein